MSINSDFFRNTVSSVLHRNPSLSNAALSKVIEAQIVNCKWNIQVSDDRLYSFRSDGYEGLRKSAKIIYISPYGFLSDIFVSLKRMFVGVTFPPSQDGDLRSYLEQGRRITIFCAIDGSEAESLIEVDQQSLCLRIYQAVFSRSEAANSSRHS